jgi:hypothetical protein
MTDANSIQSDYVLIIFITLGCIVLIYKLVLNIMRKRKRRTRERIYFILLTRSLNEIAFFFKIDQHENKLPTYRLLLKTHAIIRKYIRDMAAEFGDETGLVKDLADLYDEIERHLFDPDIAHMLYDTEESKMGETGKSKISTIQATFHKCLSKYDKIFTAEG